MLLMIGSLGCLPASAPANEVYKSVDAAGHVVYSDRADSKAAEKSVVHVDAPDPVEVARLAREQQMEKAEELQRRRQQSNDEKRNAAEEREHQFQCETARNHYYTLKDARRIFDRDADGNRVYLSDADADRKRDEARLAAVSACGT
jgi:hypothetical protein